MTKLEELKKENEKILKSIESTDSVIELKMYLKTAYHACEHFALPDLREFTKGKIGTLISAEELKTLFKKLNELMIAQAEIVIMTNEMGEKLINKYDEEHADEKDKLDELHDIFDEFINKLDDFLED